jgi:hypothetical protein
MTFPDHVPGWMLDPTPPPMPAWCRGAGESGYTSYRPESGANVRVLASPTVKVTADLSLHLVQTEDVLGEDVTHTPVRVSLWGRDGDLPFLLTANEAQALGVALLEHAGRLREVQA